MVRQGGIFSQFRKTNRKSLPDADFILKFGFPFLPFLKLIINELYIYLNCFWFVNFNFLCNLIMQDAFLRFNKYAQYHENPAFKTV